MGNEQYHPVTAVWEVTMACNMRCKHCGSSCTEALSDELTTEEALDVINQLSELGLRWITLSGGEPLTRRDLPQLVSRLVEKKIAVNIITNGWLLESQARSLCESGVSTVAVSLDGPREIHDDVRREGSYDRSEAGICEVKRYGKSVGVVTTITRQNLSHLPALREDLIRMGVDSWQVQIGLPMGNLKDRPDWLIDPSQVDDIIDFCYETMKDGRIRIYPADCIGYFNKLEQEVRRVSYQTSNTEWDGCNAGIRGFGILQNGDILGCTSIRSREFIEDSVRRRPLAEIWNDPENFSWRRDMTKKQLSGFCGHCVYGSKCLGGCANTRLTMEGSVYGENKYCSYHHHIGQLEVGIALRTDIDRLFTDARECLSQEDYQQASLLCDRITGLNSSHAEAYKLKGYADFMCGNYTDSELANRRAMELLPEDAYPVKGLALALHKQCGQEDTVLSLLDQALTLSAPSDTDLQHDIAIIKRDLGYR